MFFMFISLSAFLLAELCKMVVKAVWKLAYKQVLITICVRSTAPKALKGFIYVFVLFSGHYC